MLVITNQRDQHHDVTDTDQLLFRCDFKNTGKKQLLVLLFCCSDSPVASSHLLIKTRQYLVCRQRRFLGGTVLVTKSDTDNVDLWVGQSVSQSLTLTTSISGWDSSCHKV